MKNLSRNASCWCGSGRKFKQCHLAEEGRPRPAERIRGQQPRPPIQIKTEEQLRGIRASCQLVRQLLDSLEGRIRPGTTTEEINRWIHDATLRHGAQPAPLGYRGFPKSICTSPNEVVAHGIPNDAPLRDGDVLNVDVTCILDGYYGDASRMYVVGRPAPEALRLVEVTRECLHVGIRQVRPGNRVGDIGHAIQHLAERQGFSVVRELAGHGTGLAFHEEPLIPHFGDPRTGPELIPNMVFTIEPMVNAGRRRIKVLDDGWTTVTADGSLSAQWEHTVRVTDDGVEVLTG